MYVKRILAALLVWVAATAVAAAAPALKVLIVDGQNNHNWRATTPLLKKALEETGLFTVDVATTPDRNQNDYAQAMAKFHPAFASYNVVVSNYNGDDWPVETRKSLESYVSGGGGLVSVHAADNSFPNWKAYNEMIGLGGWGGRNETSGPYVYWKNGKFVRDTSKGAGWDPRGAAPIPARSSPAGPSHHQGLAPEIPPRPRRVVLLAPRPGQKHDRAGNRLCRSEVWRHGSQ